MEKYRVKNNLPKYVIIGAGIIGSSIARELARRGYGKITVLEKEAMYGEHASGRNSGVLHSGINQNPNSLKAKLCVEGNKLAREYCIEHFIPMKKCGTLVVAQDEKDLESVLQKGTECGVDGLQLLSKKELMEREPAVKGKSALYSPNGAIVDSREFLQSIISDAQRNGARYIRSAAVNGIHQGTNPHVHTASAGAFQFDYLINCAGLDADRIAHMDGRGLEYKIIPFRGEYMEIENLKVNSMVYQPPDTRYPFLGVHLTRETDGKVLAGPTATLSLGRESYNKEINLRDSADTLFSPHFINLMGNFIKQGEFWNTVVKNSWISFSKGAFLREIQKLAPSVRKQDLKPYRSGIRAQIVNKGGKFINDLLIEEGTNSLHILNAVSPGMTCSLAFAKHVVDKYISKNS